MKHRVNRIMAVAILTGGLLFAGTGASAATFKDLNEGFWAKDEISYLVEHEIIKGYPDGTFNPSKTITKAQGATMLVRALKLNVTNNPDPGFSDVSKNHSAYKEIAAAVAAGIFEKGEKFNPNEEMTREAVAVAIAKAFKLQSSGQLKFTDVPATSSAYKAIASLAEHDITTGYVDGTFKPNEKVTRAQFSAFVARALSTDFLPNKYNVPLNVNPAATLFHMALKKPDEAQQLFVDKKFKLSVLTKDVRNLELIEVKEVARANGQTEFLVKFKAELKEKANNALLKEGENQLYVVIKRNGYMDFKIVSLAKDAQLTKDQAPSLTEKEAIELFAGASGSYWYVVRGGEGKQNESTFTHNDMEYRYMAESLNTMEKLKTYLGKTYTSEQVTALIKKLNIIEHKGALAQPNADGGSRLMFEKATIKETASTATSKKFTLNVPLYGDGNEVDTIQGELRYEKDKGWRVYSLETIINGDTVPTITEHQALQLFKEAKNSYWYVVMGGEGKRNEERFTHKGKDYRYMAESLNTMEKLKRYLGTMYTPDQQEKQLEKLIKELGIIEHKGVLAQPDADGGSALNWGKAKIKETSGSNQGKHFEIDVPIGESSEYEALIGELRYVKESESWLVHDLNQRMSIFPK